MASLDAHITKANHNIETIALLSQDLTKKDWIVTVAFYSALLIVDAVLFQTQSVFHPALPCQNQQPHLAEL